ncbi:MAG: hypothetical protein ORN29_09975 [Rhodoferax sp.]|nr:hypothetical protein [Rhodoferax sp.]
MNPSNPRFTSTLELAAELHQEVFCLAENLPEGQRVFQEKRKPGGAGK